MTESLKEKEKLQKRLKDRIEKEKKKSSFMITEI